MIKIVNENENAEIGYPTLEIYKKFYPQLLSNYLREYKDNTEKRFIELQIEHHKTYCNDFLNNPKHSFTKWNLERFNTSRLLVIEHLELKLKSFDSYYVGESVNYFSMNLETKKLFHWLIDSYRADDSRKIKFVNIYYFLLNDVDKSIYAFDLTHDEYRILIESLYKIKVKKISESEKYKNTDIHILRSKEAEFKKKSS